MSGFFELGLSSPILSPHWIINIFKKKYYGYFRLDEIYNSTVSFFDDSISFGNFFEKSGFGVFWIVGSRQPALYKIEISAQ
jgi:hypothetical protein